MELVRIITYLQTVHRLHPPSVGWDFGNGHLAGSSTVTSTEAFTTYEHTSQQWYYDVNSGTTIYTSVGTSPAVLGVDGTASFSDKVTVGSLEIDGALTDVNDATGNNGYILKSVGTGVEWIDILSILPQSRTTGNFTATAGQTVFSFTYNVGYLDVFVNGVKLSTDRGEFNADNGTTVTLTEVSVCWRSC